MKMTLKQYKIYRCFGITAFFRVWQKITKSLFLVCVIMKCVENVPGTHKAFQTYPGLHRWYNSWNRQLSYSAFSFIHTSQFIIAWCYYCVQFNVRSTKYALWLENCRQGSIHFLFIFLLPCCLCSPSTRAW